MNGNTLDVVAPRFVVGTWDKLKAGQQRVFITFVERVHGAAAAADPAGFARGLWNDSAQAANSGANPGPGRLLNQSRLTTFIGVTSMWDRRGVISQVAAVTDINGDQDRDNFRLYGELVAGGGERIKHAFTHSIAGSGHGEFKVSRREQGLLGQPNGQFSLTQDLSRFDSDVDYRRLFGLDHNTKANSDLRAFDGKTAHLKRHVGRYGEVPLTLQDGMLGPLADVLPLDTADTAPEAFERLEAAREARSAADAFAERFGVTLTLDGLFEEMFAPDAIGYIRRAGFFDALGLDDGLTDSLQPRELASVYKRVMDLYYLQNLYELRTEFFGAVALGERLQPTPPEAEAALRSAPQLNPLAEEGASEDVRLGTPAELEEFLRAVEVAAAAYRARLRAGEGNAALYRANMRSINAERESLFSVEREEADGEARDVYTVEQGAFTVRLVRREEGLKIINLGLGN